MKLLIAFLAFDLIVIVHELGHFIAARLTGIKVLEFSLFIGPKIFSIKRGETMYSLRIIPALAYVKMEGEEEESDDARAFNKRPVWARFVTVAAGPFASIMLGVIFLAVSYVIAGVNTTRLDTVPDGSPAYMAGLRAGDKIVDYNGNSVYQPLDVGMFMYSSKGKPVRVEFMRNGSRLHTTFTPDLIPANRYMMGFTFTEPYGSKSNIVESVEPKSPASKGGLKAGDVIVKMNDKSVSTRQQISSYIYSNKNNPLNITVIRGGNQQVLNNIVPVQDKNPEQYDPGMAFSTEYGNIFSSIKDAFVNSYSITRIGIYSIAWLIQGQVPLNQMAGPVGIVSTINTFVQQSPSVLDIILNLLSISAIISIGLGVTNLLPIPPTDGFKMLFLIIEKIRRKRLPVEKEAMISMVGFVILMGLFIVLTYNDIVRIFTGG